MLNKSIALSVVLIFALSGCAGGMNERQQSTAKDTSISAGAGAMVGAPPFEKGALIGTWVSNQKELGIKTETQVILGKDGSSSIKGKSGQTEWEASGGWKYSRSLEQQVDYLLLRYHNYGNLHFTVVGIDNKTIDATFLGSQSGGLTRRYTRTSPVPSWLNYKYDPNNADIRSVGLPPLDLHKKICDPGVLQNVDMLVSDVPLGSAKLHPQNASTILCVSTDLTIHERANYLPREISSTGPSRCEKINVGSDREITISTLVAIVNRPKNFNFTRRWLWDNLRSAIQYEVLPKICPDAVSANVHVYVKGYDITANGRVYRTEEVDYPVINRPSYMSADVSADYAALVHKFISRGILLATFKGPAYKSAVCERHETNCSFQTFAPYYFGPLYPAELSILRRKLGSGGNANTGSLLKKISSAEEKLDGIANFDALARFAERDARHEKLVQERRAKEDAAPRSMFEQIDALIEKHGFGNLLIKGLADGGVIDQVQCANAAREGRTIPWYCEESDYNKSRGK